MISEFSKSTDEESFDFQSKDFSHGVYADVAMKAELQEIRLIESSYKMSPAAFLRPDFESSRFANRFYCESEGVTYGPEDGFVVGGFTWIAEMRQGRKRALTLKAHYAIAYANLVDCDEKYVRVYFLKVARFATYPYFRALFSSQVAESGLTLPPLPSLKERVD